MRIDTGGAITNAAAGDLKLTTGTATYAVIKVSDVMAGVD